MWERQALPGKIKNIHWMTDAEKKNMLTIKNRLHDEFIIDGKKSPVHINSQIFL